MIRLCHAFTSLMDLYGDYANMKVLAQRMVDDGQDVECTCLPRFEGFNPKETDMLFIGPGTEQAAIKACEEISLYAEEIKKYLVKGGIVLLSGNASALFGKGIVLDEVSYPGLGILNVEFTVAYRLRRYSEILAEGPWGETAGVVNTSCRVYWEGNPLFAISSDSDKLLGKTEGVVAGDIYATELTGPLLVNNPNMCDYFAGLLSGHAPGENTCDWYKYSLAAHNKLLYTLKEATVK